MKSIGLYIEIELRVSSLEVVRIFHQLHNLIDVDAAVAIAKSTCWFVSNHNHVSSMWPTTSQHSLSIPQGDKHASQASQTIVGKGG